MLDLISWLSIVARVFDRSTPSEPIPLIAWEQAAIFNLPSTTSNVAIDRTVKAYLQNLAERGIELQQQGIWIQSDWEVLAERNGTIPVAAASLTKIATTLASLDRWGASHRFETRIYATGAIEQGILAGDLIIEGSGDPFFVWEEAIAIGNALNRLGIRKVAGDLIIADKFYMNYRSEPQTAGTLLKQALNERLWSAEVSQQYYTMPANTPRPQLAIAGRVKTQPIPAFARLLLRHQSLPLKEILRQMNVYSNNQMAEILADLAGGAIEVAHLAARLANVSQTEIQLVNGSGLGEANRISPRAVCQMLATVDRLLKPYNLSVSELFPVAGRDSLGTVANRNLPQGTSLKTGTLARVSALAGVIDTKDGGQIQFAIINRGDRIEEFRDSQDRLLQNLAQYWQLEGLPQVTYTDWYLGDPRRNL